VELERDDKSGCLAGGDHKFSSGPLQGQDYWLDTSSSNGGPLCIPFLEPKHLVMVNVSYGLITAEAFVPPAAEAILDMAYGQWRTKTDKDSYSPNTGKKSSWNDFKLDPIGASNLCDAIPK